MSIYSSRICSLLACPLKGPQCVSMTYQYLYSNIAAIRRFFYFGFGASKSETHIAGDLHPCGARR